MKINNVVLCDVGETFLLNIKLFSSKDDIALNNSYQSPNSLVSFFPSDLYNPLYLSLTFLKTEAFHQVFGFVLLNSDGNCKI